MKKIYSIIAVASLMLTSVLSFTSCQKDEMPAPQKVQTQTIQTQQPAQQTPPVTTTTTQNDDNSGKTSMTNATGDGLSDPFKGMSGTWEYVDGEGTKCTLVLSNETKGIMSTNLKTPDGKIYTLDAKYEAKLTVGDKTYEGIFYGGVFLPDNNVSAYNIVAQKYASSASANSFNADLKVNGKFTAQAVTITKVK